MACQLMLLLFLFWTNISNTKNTENTVTICIHICAFNLCSSIKTYWAQSVGFGLFKKRLWSKIIHLTVFRALLSTTQRHG